MKQIIILTIIITAGFVGVIAFACGALLTRPDREKAKQQIKISEKKEQDNLKTIRKLNEQISAIKHDLEYFINESNAVSAENDDLQKKIEEQKNFIAANITTTTINYKGLFEYKNIQMSQNDWVVTILGDIINKRFKKYEMAIFTVSVYDNSDQLLDVSSFSIGKFEKDQTRPFKVIFPSLSRPASYCKIIFDSAID